MSLLPVQPFERAFEFAVLVLACCEATAPLKAQLTPEKRSGASALCLLSREPKGKTVEPIESNSVLLVSQSPALKKENVVLVWPP